MVEQQRESQREIRLAILIDAENISPAAIKQVLTRLQSSKALILKRAYGDWSKPNLNGWKAAVMEWGIYQVYAPTYTTGKNSADMALTIDALDLLQEQQINCFCIVSNDSDFTPLVHRLARAGAKVIGSGSSKASKAFVNACHRFIRLEEAPQSSQPYTTPLLEMNGLSSVPVLQVVPTASKDKEIKAAKEAKTTETAKEPQATQATQVTIGKEELQRVLKQAFATASTKNNWVSLSQINTSLRKHYANFSCKRFGYTNLTKLIESTQLFELRQRQVNSTPKQVVVEIRLKSAA